VIAEAANPEWASVPLVGWSLAKALADVADTHLVTQVRNREAIERTGWREGAEFTAIDSERVAHPVWRFGDVLRRATGIGWTATTALASIPYYYFERLVWQRFGGGIRSGHFDVVHRVTPLSPTIPSLLARRCQAAGVPFVWGPLNGGVAWPSQFKSARAREGEWLSSVRRAHHLLPGYRSTRASAAATMIGSRATWSQFEGYQDRCVYLPENAVDPARFPHLAAAYSGGPLRVAFVGRLVPYKGADMLLEAAAPLIRAGQVEVDILGDGPEAGSLRALVVSLGLERGVRLHGWVAHQEVSRILASSQVFGFPSVREFGGGVVLEAMAMGLVPIVADYAGPGELVTPSTGFRIPMAERTVLVAGFRSALENLIRDPGQLSSIGDRARRRVLARFTWRAKATQVLAVYDWVRGRSGRPSYGMPFPDEPEQAESADPGA